MRDEYMDENTPWIAWADEIAIDADGSITAFEGGAYWSQGQWIPIDDFDGLMYAEIGKLDFPISPEDSKVLCFERKSAAVPSADYSNLAALPVAGPIHE